MFQRVSLLAEKSRIRPRAAAVALPQNLHEATLDAMRMPAALRERVEAAAARPDVRRSPGAVTLCGFDGEPALLVLGLGDTATGGIDALRRAAAALLRECRRCGIDSARLYTPSPRELGGSPRDAGAAVGDGVSAASFVFDDYRGAASNRPAVGGEFRLALPAAWRSGFEAAAEVGRGAAAARRLAATPPNVAHPEHLAERCRAAAREVGLGFHEIDADEARRLGMGGLLAVGAAGSSPPRLLVLEHHGSSRSRAALRNRSPLLLVGKAVTFDTGGVSLKPTSSMSGMKYDMCGGAAVIGAMIAVARRKLPTPVVGVVPCAENLVGSTAYRVDDILTLCNGVTVEVTNTDAEGRLILADALAYATRYYKPASVVDLATLTGGVVTALGDSAAGLFVNEHELHRRLDIAAHATGEKLWHLPLWNEHREKMRGNHADLRNSADRKATASQGAAFLSFFVGEHAPTAMPTLPWAHLDIAGVAHAEDSHPLCEKGPTGFGVRLLTQFVENLER